MTQNPDKLSLMDINSTLYYLFILFFNIFSCNSAMQSTYATICACKFKRISEPVDFNKPAGIIQHICIYTNNFFFPEGA